MNGLSAFFMALAGPIAKQVMVSIGIGAITIVGLNAAVSSALGAAKGALGGLTGDAVQLLAMMGFFTSMSIIAGGITAGVSMVALKRFTKI